MTENTFTANTPKGELAPQRTRRGRTLFAAVFVLVTGARGATGLAQDAVPPTSEKSGVYPATPATSPSPETPAAREATPQMDMAPTPTAPEGTPPTEEMPQAESTQGAMPPTEQGAPAEAALLTPDGRLEIASDLRTVEARLGYIEQQRRDEGSIAGPIAMVTSGYGLSLVAMGVSMATFAQAREADRWDVGDKYHERLDVNGDNLIDRYDENTFRRLARSFAVIGGLGAAVGIVGSVLLARRMKERVRDEPEQKRLERRRRELRRELDYGTSVSARTIGFSLAGRF